jgi:hypothetical protein
VSQNRAALHQRDYRQEYTRRVARGAKKGLSRSQARGHPRAGERVKPPTVRAIDPGSREELALKLMRRGRSLRDTASHYHVSPMMMASSKPRPPNKKPSA